MGYQNVTVHEAHQKQREGYTYVDVRSVPEFDAGHPAGALNIPLMHRDDRTGQMVPNPEFVSVMKANFTPDTRLLIGCQVGGRSAQAAHLLAGLGFQDVSNVLGGYGGARDGSAEGWVSAGLPVETTAPGRTYETLRAKQTTG